MVNFEPDVEVVSPVVTGIIYLNLIAPLTQLGAVGVEMIFDEGLDRKSVVEGKSVA